MTSRRELFDERVARMARRSQVGMLGGRSEQAQPHAVQVVTPRVASSQMEVITFNVIDAMTVSTSPKGRVIRGGRLVMVTFEASAAGTGTTTYRVLIDGAAVTPTISHASSVVSAETSMNGNQVGAGSNVRIDITAAGMHDEAVFQIVLAG